jgi:5-methylcytosine-specific restriction endonuclease McrA
MSRLYDTRQWRRVQRMQLRRAPCCELCAERGKITVATVAHHVTRHGGNRVLFFCTPLQSLCMNCHNGAIQQQEKRGFDTSIGVDGWPTDSRHPANRPWDRSWNT